MDIFAKEFRAEMLRQIDGLINAKNVAALEAEQEAIKLRTEQAELTNAKTRLTNEECPVSVCPYCFWMRHESSALCSTEPTPDDVDQLKCKSCGHEWEQPE